MSQPWAAQAKIWKAARKAGMLVLAQVVYAGSAKVVEAWVDYRRADVVMVDGGTVSAEHQIEYPHTELPSLAEGDQVKIGKTLYRVRRDPFVPTSQMGYPDDDFARIALLTRVAC